jgi:DNA-binding CsgD family transcriptional regulator
MLLGRGPELEQIDRLVAEARGGSGGALVIVGEPGIGKTSLLAEAEARAEDLRVIKAAGIEAEATLPYALLGETVAPLLDGLGELPEPQAGAIGAALALGPSPGAPGDRFATCAAFVSLLANAAEQAPLLMIIDDAQWLDSPSAECLAYASRRLENTRVALLAAARPGGEGPLGMGIPERISLSGLGREDARTLLGASAPEAASNVVESLLEIAAGNPLALRELPAQLSEEQRLGRAPIDHAPVGSVALLEAFEAQLAALGPDDRFAVLVASAALDRELAPMIAACGDLGLATSALERAEAAGVLRIGEEHFSFSHPLVRAVAYERGAAPERRRAHSALAEHCGPDARAWHLAAATLGPDTQAADLLEEAAGRATARGAHSAAADALQRAAHLSPDPQARSRRLYGAALAAAVGGAYDRCAALLEPLTEIADPILRARARHGLAVVTMTGGTGLAPDAPVLLGDEAELVLPVRPATAAAMHADAALLAGTAGNFRLGVSESQRATAVLPGDASPMIRCQVHAMSGIALALAGDIRHAREKLDEAGHLLAQIDSLSPATQSVVLGLHARVCSGQEQTLRAELARLIEMAREADTFGVLPFLLAVAADVAYRIGDWEAAVRDSCSVELAEEYGQGGILPFCLVVRGRLRAARGETSQARAEIERGIALAQEVGSLMVVNWGRAALGFLELGIGQAEEAVAELERVEAFAEESGLADPMYLPWAPDLVEAYVRAGRLADAERTSSALGRRAKRAGGALSLALAARCRGLVESEGFEARFERALAHHERADATFEIARTLLAYGSRLHRARRRVDGREKLRAALEIFERLGARPWIERTTAELRAAGAIRRKPIADPDRLSPQEIRVALAVAEGATNKEVAAKLFLSPKTIEFHLGRAYRKLGIHSRTELATLVAEGALDPGDRTDATRV